MDVKLLVEAIIKLICGIVLVAMMIFIPAGTMLFPNGWILMIVLFIPMFSAGIIMMLKSPQLLKRRLKAKETQKEQNILIKLSGAMFVTGFAIAGLDYRFNWSKLPNAVIITSILIFLLSYLIYGEVIRENMYLSRAVEVQKNQRVIDTGLYSIVRHPMYITTIFLFLSMPLILGSVYSFVVFLFYPFIIVKRIKYEEEFLEKELAGYCEYKKKVKYRLIPFIW